MIILLKNVIMYQYQVVLMIRTVKNVVNSLKSVEELMVVPIIIFTMNVQLHLHMIAIAQILMDILMTV